MIKLPHKALAYIRTFYKEAYFKSINELPQAKVFKVVLHENETVHYLDFDSEGVLMNHVKTNGFENVNY